MAHNPLPSNAFADGVVIDFERQPIDVARASGLEFRAIDRAAMGSAVGARVGTSYVATMPGWRIHCERPKGSMIRVVRLVRVGLSGSTEPRVCGRLQRAADASAARREPGRTSLGEKMTRRCQSFQDLGTR